MKKILLPLVLIPCITNSYAPVISASHAMTSKNDTSHDQNIGGYDIAKQIDSKMHTHYKLNGMPYDKGTFISYLHESQYSPENLGEELGGSANVDDSRLTRRFVDTFPYEKQHTDEQGKRKEIFKLLQRYYSESKNPPHLKDYLERLYGEFFCKEVIYPYETLQKKLHSQDKTGKYHYGAAQSHKADASKPLSKLFRRKATLEKDATLPQVKKMVERERKNLAINGLLVKEGRRYQQHCAFLAVLAEDAINTGKISIADYLLSFEHIVPLTNKKMGCHYFLHMVCQKSSKITHNKSYVALAKKLIEKDSPLSSRDWEIALYNARKSDNIPLVDTLLSYQAIEFGSMNSDGLKPIHVACHNGHWKVVKLLLRKVADPYIAVKKCILCSSSTRGHIARLREAHKTFDDVSTDYKKNLKKASQYHKANDVMQYKEPFSLLTESYKKLLRASLIVSYREEIVNLVFKKSPRELQSDFNGDYPLAEELIQEVAGRKNYFQALLKKCPDLINTSFNGLRLHEPLLHAVCGNELFLRLDRNSTLRAANQLLSVRGIDTNAITETGATALVRAIEGTYFYFYCRGDGRSFSKRHFRSLKIVQALVEHPNTNRRFLLNFNGEYKRPVLLAHDECCKIISIDRFRELKEIIAYLLAHKDTDIYGLYRDIQNCKLASNNKFAREAGEMIENAIFPFLLCAGYLRGCNRRAVVLGSSVLNIIIKLCQPTIKLT